MPHLSTAFCLVNTAIQHLLRLVLLRTELAVLILNQQLLLLLLLLLLLAAEAKGRLSIHHFVNSYYIFTAYL
jgi:hypothetical protein